MTDWIDELTPDEREGWDSFVEHFRREAVEKIAGSGAMISLVPSDGFDVKFAAELGAAIMLDKPIIAVAMPGAVVPSKLREIADEVVVSDIDTEEGRSELTRALDRVIGT